MYDTDYEPLVMDDEYNARVDKLTTIGRTILSMLCIDTDAHLRRITCTHRHMRGEQYERN